ncbi:hypothetical protein I3760_03G118000 [Carya illinoinensis]|nr:hypothetical protein I3760_03G118000 [Carya illinoinensis]
MPGTWCVASPKLLYYRHTSFTVFSSLPSKRACVSIQISKEKQGEEKHRQNNSEVMATILLLFLFSAIFTVDAQQAGQSVIRPGSLLTPTGTNSSWLSHSGLYAFGFYKQGNGYAVGIFIAGIPQKTLVWTANRDNPPLPAGVKLNFTSDGRLILQSVQAGIETGIVSSTEGATAASMLDSGNFVLYNSDNLTIWQSFDQPTDTFLPSQKLTTDEVLFSSRSDTDHSTGFFRLIMQQDGWLAMYPVGTPFTLEYGYFGQGISGEGTDVSLNFDTNGHLYLLNGTGIHIVNITSGSPTKGIIYRLRIDPDGILRHYSHNLDQNADWKVTWSGPTDMCAPKGLCGINGFCVINDQEASCKCLPGFKRVNEDSWALGCERNFDSKSCKSNEAVSGYNMEVELNTIWENANYSTLRSPTQDACGEACLRDCNCEVALYKDGECRKQRLPLRFGRRKLDDSSIALIKVGVSSLSTDPIVPKESKKEIRVDILIISVSLLVFACIVLAVSGIVVYKYRVWANKNISNNEQVGLGEDVAPKSYTYAELEKVTDGFKEELGRGAFGIVYKGAIWNGEKIVAVKRLDKLMAEREREFQTEVKVIGRTHHKNLVRLLGYCHDGLNRLLVYDYMSNGSLADILFKPSKQRPSWDRRIEIARNIAKGILYLHEECEPQIIHCDIKPHNILMDQNGCAKLADFGLAKLLKPDQTKTYTDIRGTKGYVAPEWHRNLPVTVKVDVYSFGIVLLEIICCRRNADFDLPEEEALLEEWAYHCFECGELGKLLNDEVVNKKQLERMVKVALWCILDEPSLRPSMMKVLHMLEGTVDIPIPPSPTSFLTAL